MSLKAITGTCILMITSFIGYTQVLSATEQCASHKRLSGSSAKNTVSSLRENDYDVKHVKIDVALNNESVNIRGNVTLHAVVQVPQMDVYTFELDEKLTVDSVIINGTSLTVLNNKNIRSVNLNAPLAQGAAFTAVIYYGGLAEEGNGYYMAGLNKANADPWGVPVVFTYGEPYLAAKWWPCKQSLQDKIDSADIWVTVPNTLKAGSNGLLKKVTALPGGRDRYEWHTNYATDYYLFSVSVAPYIDYSFRVPLPGTADSMLVQNYIYNTPGALDSYKAGIDSTGDMLQYFSEIFGVYPFAKEKYGHCIAPLPGGMEHQTMTTCGDFGPMLISHELAHQWFGDHVTCATWRDIWLNEGFASYAEYLFLEHFRPEKAAAHLQGFHNRVLLNNEKRGAIYVDDTTNSNRIFDGRLSYSKPAAVLHTLRYIAGNDELFFQLLRKFQQQYAFKNATTNDFKVLAEQTLQTDLDTFFDQWIYKEGYPIYRINWNQVGDDVFIKIIQTTSVSQSVPLFYTPLQIELQSPGANGTMTIDNNANEQLVRIKYDRRLTGIDIDPKNYILNGDAGSFRDPELGLNEVTSSDIMVWPNGTKTAWSVTGLPVNSDWLLTDVNGKILQSGSTGTQTWKVIYADDMATGIYFLAVLKGKDHMKTIKLIKE